MADLKIEGLCKRYGQVEVLKNIDLDIKDGEFVVFVGPSGCGKSTLLRMICGLDEVSAGQLLIDGEKVNDVPRDPHLDHMRAHHEYASRPSITSFSCVPGNGFQVRMFEVNRRVQGQDVVGVHIVGALGERPKT